LQDFFAGFTGRPSGAARLSCTGPTRTTAPARPVGRAGSVAILQPCPVFSRGGEPLVCAHMLESGHKELDRSRSRSFRPDYGSGWGSAQSQSRSPSRCGGRRRRPAPQATYDHERRWCPCRPACAPYLEPGC
jgi:hypothetical protein